MKALANSVERLGGFADGERRRALVAWRDGIARGPRPIAPPPRRSPIAVDRRLSWVVYRRGVADRLAMTLDTSCVSALANPQPTSDPAEVAALESLIAAARQGQIDLQLTMAYERDFERWTDAEARQGRLRWLADAPIARRVPGVFRFDVSRWDGGDVLAGDEHVELDRKLREILTPSRATRPTPSYEDAPGAAAKLMSDIDHLIAHFISGVSFFVTLDDSTILKRAEHLASMGIDVRRPTSALVAYVKAIPPVDEPT